MSLESQLQQLKTKHKILDGAFQEFHKIVQGTQDVVSLVLKEQREYNGKTDYRLEALEKIASQHTRQLNKVEELLIQIVNNLAIR